MIFIELCCYCFCYCLCIPLLLLYFPCCYHCCYCCYFTPGTAPTPNPSTTTEGHDSTMCSPNGVLRLQARDDGRGCRRQRQRKNTCGDGFEESSPMDHFCCPHEHPRLSHRDNLQSTPHTNVGMQTVKKFMKC